MARCGVVCERHGQACDSDDVVNQGIEGRVESGSDVGCDGVLSYNLVVTLDMMW